MVWVWNNKDTVQFLLTMTVIKGAWESSGIFRVQKERQYQASFFCQDLYALSIVQAGHVVGFRSRYNCIACIACICKGFMPPCHCSCYSTFLECHHSHSPPIGIPFILQIHFLSVTFPDLQVRIMVSFLPPSTEGARFFNRHLLHYASYDVHLPLGCGLLEGRDHGGPNLGCPTVAIPWLCT